MTLLILFSSGTDLYPEKVIPMELAMYRLSVATPVIHRFIYVYLSAQDFSA